MLAPRNWLRSWLRPWLASVLALGLAAAPAHAAGPKGGHEGLLAAAEELEAAGRYEAALQAYAGAFETMPSDLRTGEVGEYVALEVGRVALADYQARAEVESLEVASGLLRDFIAGVEASGSKQSLQAARQRLDELEARIPPDELAVVEPEPVEAEPADQPELAPTSTGSDDRSAPLAAMGKAGVALLVVGGATAVGGVVLVALPPSNFAFGDPNATRLTTTRPPGWAMLGGGVAVAVTGAVLLGIDRARAKSRDDERASRAQLPAVSLHPWWGRGQGGLAARGHF